MPAMCLEGTVERLSRVGAVAIVAAMVGLAGFSACDCRSGSKGGATDKPDAGSTAAAPAAPPEQAHPPEMPRSGDEFAPSLARLADGHEADTEALSKTDSCAECHGQIAREWRDSMHRFASFNNPLYRIAFDKFVEAKGDEKGDFCAGCHDPVPMIAGETDATVEATNPRAHVGVTCTTCHGITSATADGNGSYTLQTSDVPVPEQDSPTAAGIEAHRDRLRSLKERSNLACASCHRGFLSQATGHDVLIAGFNEWTPWRRSGWSGNPATRIDRGVPQKDCVGCHMPKTDAGHRSHRFPGGHTTFAAMLDAPKQLEAIRELLDDAATIDVAAMGHGESRMPMPNDEEVNQRLEAGERVWFDVVVRNVGGGHRFPGGQRDLRDTWIAVTVETADGTRVAEAGTDHRDSGDDPSAHRLRAELLNEKADRERTHSVAHFRTPAYNHTIAPRSAEVVRYEFRLPENLSDEAFPLTVDAKLIHRRLIQSFRDDACRASKTDRGQAFLKQTEKQLGRRPDPCIDQPMTVMETDSGRIFRDKFEPGDNKAPFRRWFDRGLGLRLLVSQRLDEALDSLERAEEAVDWEVEVTGSKKPLPEHKKSYAMVEVIRAQVYARQRRHVEAIEALDEAEKLIGKHPAIHRVRGRAYANVWKFEEAVDEFGAASDMVDDDRVWRQYAISLGSLGRSSDALVAAQKGLEMEPRDADLLRAQYLAVRNLDVPEAWLETARRAYHLFKEDDRAAQLQAECSDQSERCRRERLPVHTHPMFGKWGISDGESGPGSRD